MQSIPDALDKDGSRQYAGRPTRWDLTNQADICTQGEGWWGKGGGSGSQGTGYRPFMCICVQGVHVCAGSRMCVYYAGGVGYPICLHDRKTGRRRRLPTDHARPETT